MTNYERIARAIKYIHEHSAEQPALEEVARAVHLSPYHFHRLFKEWAGITPKKFLQYINLNHAKKLLVDNRTLQDAAFQTGLSSTSRLHDLFVTIEGMTPGEFKNGGHKLEISYDFADSLFGTLLIASTGKGICNILFTETCANGVQILRDFWPEAVITEKRDTHIKNAVKVFNGRWTEPNQIKLHIKGSNYQLKVWEALLEIAPAKLTTYSELAARTGNAKASRAVGNAVAKNPVAYLIPCHRVIKKTGAFGEYRWGSVRKAAIIGWEAAKNSPSG